MQKMQMGICVSRKKINFGKEMIFLFIIIMLSGSVLAVGDLAESAIDSKDVKNQNFLRDLFSGVFSIGTFTTSGVYDIDYLLGETVVIRFSDVPYNVKCNDARFVVEIYKPDGTVSVMRNDIPFKIAGWSDPNRELKSVVNYGPGGSGSYSLVEYLYCYDSDFQQNNPEWGGGAYHRISFITDADKTKFQVRDAATTTCGNKGQILYQGCDSDGNKVKQYVKEDCEAAVQLIEECQNQCIDDTCVSPEKYTEVVELQTGTTYEGAAGSTGAAGGAVGGAGTGSDSSKTPGLIFNSIIALIMIGMLWLIWR